MSPPTLVFLADCVLVLHLAFAGYIVLGLAAVWLLRLLKSPLAANPWFRLSHLAAMAVVVGEALTGVFCPLTTWEYELRLRAGQGARYEPSFLNRFAERYFYHDFSETFAAILYVSFLALIVATLFVAPVDWKRLRRRG